MPNPDNIKGKGFDKHPENINTEGYEKGKKHRATILRRLVDTANKFKNPVTKKEESGIVEDQLDWSLIIKGLGGDVPAIKEIKDTLYGKIQEKQAIEHSGEIKATPDLSKLTELEIAQFAELSRKLHD